MSSFRFLIAGMVIPLLSLACASRQQPDLSPASAHMVCVVPGVSGDAGPLRSAITEAGFQDVRTFAWGSPVFLMNFQSTSIHEQAEKDLAARLTEWFGQRPDCRIDLVGHSAGCGVILGALAKLDPKMKVHQVILLAPSVSPQYDLAPALRHIAGNLDVFYSDQDTFF